MVKGTTRPLIRGSGLGARKWNSGLAGARGQRPEGRLSSGIDLEDSGVTGESTKGEEARATQDGNQKGMRVGIARGAVSYTGRLELGLMLPRQHATRCCLPHSALSLPSLDFVFLVPAPRACLLIGGINTDLFSQ